MNTSSKHVLIALALVLLLPGTAFAVEGDKSVQTFAEGEKAFEQKDFEKTLRLMLPLAEQGHAVAQANIGMLYFNGYGVPQDDQQAYKWYRLAAERGYAPAQALVAWLLDTGRGVPQDFAEAHKWYLRAAEQGDTGSATSIGFMYYAGRGVPQNFTEGVKWYRKAAEKGDGVAQYNLGAAYGNGEGAPQDYVLAHKWFNLAAVNYPADAVESRNGAIRARDEIAKRMTREQIAEAQRLAREWKPKK